MTILIYLCGTITIVLAIGGFASYAASKHLPLLLSSLISIAASCLAMWRLEWWPLFVSLFLNFVLSRTMSDSARR